MNDLSLKGVARRYMGLTGSMSVANDVLGGVGAGSHSLRQKLESEARTEYSFPVSECIYGWTARFEQTWTHITVRIELNPDAGISNATMNTLRTTWENAIESTWTNRWGCARSGELMCRLSIDVQWVATGEHHAVRVRTGPGRSNMGTWDTFDSGGIAAHEFGHMLGNPDEYTDSACTSRSPVNTGTVMDNNTNTVPARLMSRFASNIGSNMMGL